MTLGLILTAFGLGLRHGIDWDHIAAIADLSSAAENRRRGFFLSFLYAVGHGVVVLMLGIAAIAFGSVLPSGVETWMGRIVGATLLALGLWVLIELLRKGREFRLRSRWILVLSGTFAGIRRVRDARTARRVAIAHSHDHDHVEPEPGVEAIPRHDDVQAHDHAHESEVVIDLDAEDVANAKTELAVPLATGATDAVHGVTGGSSVTDDRRRWFDPFTRPRGGHRHGGIHHAHVHKHEAHLAADQPAGPGNGTAAGIGVLHGIGIESPTQIAVFVASTSIVGATAGIGLLIAWVVGLIVANSALAALAAGGLLEAERNFTLYVAVAVFVAVTSIIMGVLLLAGGEGFPGL